MTPKSQRFFVTALCLAMALSALSIRDAQAGRLEWRIKIIHSALPFIDLLQSPSAIALAMENCGLLANYDYRFKILHEREIEITRPNKVALQSVIIQYRGLQSHRYSYLLKIKYGVGALTQTFLIPAEVDARDIKTRQLSVAMDMKGSGLVPSPLLEFIENKIKNFVNESKQLELVNYLKSIDNTRSFNEMNSSFLNRGDSVYAALLTDGYHRRSPAATSEGGREGRDEPLSDQLWLLATLFIWFILAPLAFAIFVLIRRRGRHRA